MSFPFAPKGWLYCQGQELSADTYKDLYRLLGNAYGGRAPQTFCLPDLRGAVAMGTYPGGPADYQLGQRGGGAQVALDETHLPRHDHPYTATLRAGVEAESKSPKGGLPCAAASPQYAKSGGPTPGTLVNMAAGLGQYYLEAAGGTPHENRQPFLVLNYAIALEGEYPSRA